MIKKIIRYECLVLLLFVCGCSNGFSIDRIKEVELKVVSVSPEKGERLEKLDSVNVSLSAAINPDTVNDRTFLVTSFVELDLSDSDAGDIVDKIEDEKIISLPGIFQISEDKTKVTWTPNSNLDPLARYQIILTSGIETPDYYPLNQTPGEGNTPFVSWFDLGGRLKETGEVEEGRKDGEEGVSEATSSVDYNPPESIVINELYYDSNVSDTDGNVFIELSGTPSGDISGYLIRLINGSNGQKTDEIVFSEDSLIPEDGFFVVSDSQTEGSDQTRVENSDYLDNFDPQNGPDSVQLLSPFGELVDAVGYGEGMIEVDVYGNVLYEGVPAVDAGEGFSISRIDGEDTSNNEIDFVLNESPSPGSDFVLYTEEVEEFVEDNFVF